MTNLRACRVQRRSLMTDERGRSSGQDCVVTGQGEVEGHRPCHRPGHTHLGQRGGNEEKQQSRLDVRKYSFFQRTINVWNNLSTDCVYASTSSVNIFKNRQVSHKGRLHLE